MIVNRETCGELLSKVAYPNGKSYYVHVGPMQCLDKNGLIFQLGLPLHIYGELYCYGLKTDGSISVTENLMCNSDIEIKDGSLKVFGNLIIHGKISVEKEIDIHGYIKSYYFGGPSDSQLKRADIKCGSLSCFGDVEINGQIRAKNGCKIRGQLQDKFSFASGLSDKLWC